MKARTDDKDVRKENTKIRLYNSINCVSDRFREKIIPIFALELKFKKK